ncbi:penicillin-binding protein 2 [Natronosporangium hydrolyticum]|uniref:Penicillin-binding protein 2 n=1 Tax=Natronosporangium hydrolyticum TaxID=2811111 RepID=A0A895YF48_9ACTN|nr:penicillin-binding transpeptidase domain-containing protein [Natronosporangium hydrolyticum]QSB14762.1 penicillin-binding protein 2 [Natronosporangium hydrolyticum]
MNAPLRRVGIIVMVMFGLLFANLNWVQGYKADEYRNSPHNAGRVQIAEYQRERGPILVGRDGTAAAVSIETDGRLTYLRTYPEDGRWAHVVGYKPVNLAATGIERFENDSLAGTGDRFFVDRMRDLFTGDQSAGGTVQTTLSRGGQQTAFEELNDNQVGADRGAVIAIDPRTGGVQALVSMPSFDPNPLASHDPDVAQDAYEALDADPERPLANRVLSERFEPGSVFKVIDAAAALASGDYQPDSNLEGGAQYTAPTAGSPIGNAPGVSCPNSITLEQALVVSCNTAFSWLAAEQLSGDELSGMADAFGFRDDELSVGRLDGEGMSVATSQLGELHREDGQYDQPTLALTAIGQASVQMTPIQGALIAATVANGGTQMAPYLVEQLQDGQLRPVYQASPESLREPITGEVASELEDMMVAAVERGTGTNAQIPGYRVGGKTGTAETGDGAAEHGWFVGFVIDDGEPISAVAVFLENAGSGGSGEAARIAGQVMHAVVNDQGGS